MYLLFSFLCREFFTILIIMIIRSGSPGGLTSHILPMFVLLVPLERRTRVWILDLISVTIVKLHAAWLPDPIFGLRFIPVSVSIERIIPVAVTTWKIIHIAVWIPVLIPTVSTLGKISVLGLTVYPSLTPVAEGIMVFTTWLCLALLKRLAFKVKLEVCYPSNVI